MSVLARLRGLRRYKGAKWDYVALLMIAPYVFYLCVFTIYPFFMALAGSLSDWDILSGEMTFRGFIYYKELFQDHLFFKSLKNNLVYLAVQVPPSILLGLLVATLLNRSIKLRAFFRGVFFVPVITPVVVLSIVWKWMYQMRGGVFNYMLDLVGIPPVAWLSSEAWSMPSIALMKVWTDVGFYGVIFLAALQGVPADLEDAARVDGANGWQLFWRVRLPVINPTIVFSIVMSTIWAFQVFSEPFLMTDGGPLDSSQTVTLYLYEEGFIWSRLGYACAMGVVTAIIILTVTLVQRRLTEREVGF